MRSAQRWLRDQTRGALLAEAAQARDAATWTASELADQLEIHLAGDNTERPFGDPFEWAGLATISLRAGDA